MATRPDDHSDVIFDRVFAYAALAFAALAFGVPLLLAALR